MGAVPRDPETGIAGSRGELVAILEALASPTRLDLLHRLAHPAFVPDLARDLGLTRQTVKKHLDALVATDMVLLKQARRGPLPATQYVANPAALFAFKEEILALASPNTGALPPQPTRTLASPQGARDPGGAGLLLVHGDLPGRWIPLRGTSWVVGRDARDDIPLVYDAFASVRHALVQQDAKGWQVTDLQSRNGTLVNFRTIPPGVATPLRPGDVLTVGRSHFVLRDGA